jgi:hypothetical protein
VKLAEEEKFIIPLSGRTISHSIEYIPRNEGECEFIEPTITYKSLAQSQVSFGADDEITSLLPLKTRELVFVSDPFFNIASYSIDRHSLLKPKLPKTSLMKGNPSELGRPMGQIINPHMVTTNNEEYIYYLTPNISFIFHYSMVSDM